MIILFGKDLDINQACPGPHVWLHCTSVGSIQPFWQAKFKYLLHLT